MTSIAYFRGAVLAAAVIAAAAPAAGQTTRLALADALRMAAEHSEAVEIARAGESRAGADEQRAHSQRMPQVSFTGSYSRTLASEFSNAFQPTGPVCSPLSIVPGSSLADQVAEIERAASCGSLGSSSLFNLSSLPFGQRNIYQASVSLTQALYAGGRIAAQENQSSLNRHIATLSTSAAEAQLALQVTQAFFDAALSDRLVTIAESGYDQAEAAYEQTRLSFEAGRQPEFELLRAQVARDNQRPTVIRNRAARDVAYLRLRQLLKLDASAPLTLDVDLDAPDLSAPAPFAAALDAVRASGAKAERAAVQQADELVQVRSAGIALAHAERMPSVSLTSSYARVGYPHDVFPGFGDFRTNSSVGVAVQIPVFTGMRLKADEVSARADLTQAQAQLRQTQELAELDSATALEDLTAAEAVWQASAGTIEQAQRAYQIAELRNREGLSTQLELSDSRLSLQVAEANRAQAARDLQVARAHVALLPNLPVTAR